MSTAGQSESPFHSFIESAFYARGGGGDIYIIVSVSGTTHVYGINSETGDTLFDATLSNASHISVGPTGRVFVTRTASNQIVEIAPDDGATIATYSVTSPRRGTCSGSLVLYGAATSNRFAAVDEDFTAEQWSYTTGVPGSSPLGIDIDSAGNSYWSTATDTTGFVVKLNSSGAEQWKANPPATWGFVTRPVYFGGYLFVVREPASTGATNHKIVKLSATDGSELASIDTQQVLPRTGFPTVNPYALCTANDGKAYLVYLIEDLPAPPFDTGIDTYQIQRFASDLSSMEEAYDTYFLDNFAEFVVPNGGVLVSRSAAQTPTPGNRQVELLTTGLDSVWVKDLGSSSNPPTVACGGYIARS